MFVDSHCHLDKLSVENQSIKDYVMTAKEQGVEHILCVCITLDDYPTMAAKVRGIPSVSLSAGVHPCHEDDVVSFQELAELCSQDEVVAIGETGLDYYHSTDHIDIQKQSFIDHIKVGQLVDKPLIIHTRDARQDTIDILRQYGNEKTRGVFHCFTESLEMAEQGIELGFYISFSGIVTFNSAKDLQEVAKTIPLDKMLIETDAPWLAPVPHRGKANQPAYVTHVAKFIADLRGISVAEVAAATTKNFYDLFNHVQADSGKS